MTLAEDLALSLPENPITSRKSEQLGFDHPLAVEVAKPLFDSHVLFIGLTERPYLNNPDDFWARPWHTYNLCIQGSLLFETKDEKFSLGPGDLCYFPPGVTHSRRSEKNSPVQFLYIRLEDHRAWASLKKNGVYRRSYESADTMYLLIRKILNAHKSRNTAEINLALSYSLTILELLKQEKSLMGGDLNSGVQELRRMISDIETHPERDWNTTEMSVRLKVSKRKLNRMFIKEYGVAPYEMITKLRISKAAISLARTHESIANIASSLGYQSSYSFSNLFKKHAGLRPKDYRKQYHTKASGRL